MPIAAAVFVITLALPGRAAGLSTGFIDIIRADRIAMMNALDPDSAHAYFDTPNSYGLILRGNWASLQAARRLKARGWHFRFAETYFDFASFRADVAAHTIAPGVTAVVYDNEDGPTRQDETGAGGFYDPASRRAATRAFYTLARAHDLTVILAPGSVCNASHVFFRRMFAPQACYEYLRDIAPFADIIDPQFQGLIRDPDVHLAVTRESAALMKAANPSIRILSEFTTNPERRLSPAQNIAAMRNALPYVNGLWTNLGASQEGIESGVMILRAVH